MTFPDRAEIKERIYSFLKHHVDLSVSQINQNLQYHSIENLANEYKCEGDERRKLKLLFLELFNEVALNGIIARKREEQFFFITEKGKKFLMDQTFDIYDPDLYLQNLPELNEIAHSYIKESVYAFNKDLHISSIITLGVASESLILEIAKKLQEKTNNSDLKLLLNKNVLSTNKIINKIDEICKSKISSYEGYYKSDLHSVAHFIRHSRNEYGHPNKTKTSFEEAHALLTMFKKYSLKVIELKEEISKSQF